MTKLKTELGVGRGKSWLNVIDDQGNILHRAEDGDCAKVTSVALVRKIAQRLDIDFEDTSGLAK